MKRLFPEKYNDISRKLEGLKAGADYTITDRTKEYIIGVWVLICGTQKLDMVGNRILAYTSKYQKDLDKFIHNFGRKEETI